MIIQKEKVGDICLISTVGRNYQATLQSVGDVERIVINGKVKSRRALREILKEMRG